MTRKEVEGQMEVRGAGEVRQFEAIRLRSELNTRRIMETVYGTRRSDRPHRLLYLLLQIVIFWPIHDRFRSLLETKGKKQGPGGCAPSPGVPHQIVLAVRFRSSSGLSLPYPSCPAYLPHTHPFPSSCHSLSTLPTSHVVVCLSFFGPFSCESSS